MIEDFERCLGEIQTGWKTRLDGVQIVRTQRPGEALQIFATLGLSRYPLVSVNSGKIIRLELTVALDSQVSSGWVMGAIEQVAMELVATGRAVLRGDVLGPLNPFFPGTPCSALYCTSPFYLPDDRHELTDDAGNGVAVVWLLPITAAEVALRQHRGWDDLEGELDLIPEHLHRMTR